MTSFTLSIHPRALGDAKSAAAWYEERRPGHGDRFRREVDHVLSRIHEHPESYQALNARYRRAFTRRFPFVVVYRVASDAIQVLGVMPTAADPTLVSLQMDQRSN